MTYFRYLAGVLSLAPAIIVSSVCRRCHGFAVVHQAVWRNKGGKPIAHRVARSFVPKDGRGRSQRRLGRKPFGEPDVGFCSSRKGLGLANARRLSEVLRSSSSSTTSAGETISQDEPDEEEAQQHSQNPTTKTRSPYFNTNIINWKRVNKQISLFGQIALPYYQESPMGRRLLAGLLGLTLLNSGVSVALNFFKKHLWNAISVRNATGVLSVLQCFSVVLVLGAPIVALYRFQRDRLAVHWREWMTERTLHLYTSSRVYYNLERGGGGAGTDSNSGSSVIDNPDQRITEDVNTFCSFSLELAITVLTSLIDLACFCTILWCIDPRLFGVILLYATMGTLASAVLGKRLVRLNVMQLQKEADLRYALVRFRDNAESIAFYGGEDLEGQAVQRRLRAVTANRRQLNRAQLLLEVFTTSYRYLVQVLPIAVICPKYFRGEIGLGVISQSTGAFNHILSDFSIIVSEFERLSSFSAGMERLSSFYEEMRCANLRRQHTSPLLQLPDAPLRDSDNDRVVSDSSKGDLTRRNAARTNREVGQSHSSFGTIDLQYFASTTSTNGELVVHHDCPNNDAGGRLVLSMDGLDLCTPDKKRLLVKDLTLQLRECEHLLIVGNSGAGKSSLLRAVAGLWTVGNGVIQRPANEDVYFLPQRPYCTLGSLRDQLLYPSLPDEAYHFAKKDREKATDDLTGVAGESSHAHRAKQSFTDKELLSILERVDLLDVARQAGDGNPAAGLDVTGLTFCRWASNNGWPLAAY